MHASKLNRTHTAAKSTSTRSAQGSHQIQQSTSGNLSSNNNNVNSDDNNDTTNNSGMDQDEDIIQAVEEAQEGNLDEAANEAELTVAVMDIEQKAASKALS